MKQNFLLNIYWEKFCNEDISFYLIHNNSEDRIDLRNRLKNLANKLNIKFIEIYKQRKNLKIKFNFKL